MQLEQSGGKQIPRLTKFQRLRKAIENREDVRTATNAEEEKKKRSRHHYSPAETTERRQAVGRIAGEN